MRSNQSGDLRVPMGTAVAGPAALGWVVGAVAGARILMIVSNDKLRLLFIAVLVALGVQMALQAFGIDFLKGSK
jgi:uncharacterized membrane protein YfcA